MKKYNILIPSLLLVSLFVFEGCRRDEEPVTSNDMFSTRDNNEAENIFADIKRVVEEAADDEGQSAKYANNKSGAFSFGSCATVTFSPAWPDTTFPKIMEIDFGSTNCTGNYGIKRRGKIVVKLMGRYRDAGTSLIIDPQNYFVNDIGVDGEKVITNNGYNSSGNLEYEVQVTNGILTYQSGATATWESTRINEWIEGDSTTFFSHGIGGICDDVYLITGTANGENRNGLLYTMNITSPLRKEVCCRWLVSGTIVISPSGLPARILDFGSGSCDNTATITINNNTFVFQM